MGEEDTMTMNKRKMVTNNSRRRPLNLDSYLRVLRDSHPWLFESLLPQSVARSLDKSLDEANPGWRETAQFSNDLSAADERALRALRRKFRQEIARTSRSLSDLKEFLESRERTYAKRAAKQAASDIMAAGGGPSSQEALEELGIRATQATRELAGALSERRDSEPLTVLVGQPTIAEIH